MGRHNLVPWAAVWSLMATAALANDNFAGVVLTGSNGAITGTNVTATGEPGEPATAGGGARNTHWFSWTAPDNGDITIETCGGVTNFDTALQVFTGNALNALTLSASNDDLCGTQSRVAMPVTAGTTYRIQLDGFEDNVGNYTLSWDFVAQSPIAAVACPVGTTATGSGFATGGTGLFRDEIYWLDWNCGGVTTFQAGINYIKTWNVGDGTIITGRITNLTAPLKTYNTGVWILDRLDDLYSGVNPIGLANAIGGQDPTFDLSISILHNGFPISLDFAVADAEETATTESLSVSTTGTAFEQMEQVGSTVATGVGTNRVTMTNAVGNGGTVVLSSSGSPTFRVSMQAGGNEAIAFGIRSRLDYSDAPLFNYGSAFHRVKGTWHLGSKITHEVANYNDPNAAGDEDDGVALPVIAQNTTINIPVSVSGPGGFLQAWIDWNGDGDFLDVGEQIASNIQDGRAGDGDGVTNGVIQLSANVPPVTTTSQTFARFRWSTETGLGANGGATDGEVEDYALTVVAGTPSLQVVKSATYGANVAADGATDNLSAGTVVTYTYTVTNTGTLPLTGVELADIHNGLGTDPIPDPDSAMLTDNLPSGDSSNINTTDGKWDNLAPGDVLTVTADYTVTQDDLDRLQ